MRRLYRLLYLYLSAGRRCSVQWYQHVLHRSVSVFSFQCVVRCRRWFLCQWHLSAELVSFYSPVLWFGQFVWRLSSIVQWSWFVFVDGMELQPCSARRYSMFRTRRHMLSW